VVALASVAFGMPVRYAGMPPLLPSQLLYSGLFWIILDNDCVGRVTGVILIGRLHSRTPDECNRDLDEVAGATDAIACSHRSYFLRCNSRLLGDNRARYAAHEFLIDPASATSEAIKRRNDHSIPINKDITGPRPPQTPATSSKSPYRKCAGGMLFRSPRMFCAGALVDGY